MGGDGKPNLGIIGPNLIRIMGEERMSPNLMDRKSLNWQAT
jgi:hypothetical protein